MKKQRFSISLKLTCWFSAIFLFGFIAFGMVMWTDLAITLSQGRDKTLATRSRRLLELFESTRSDSPARRLAKFDDFAQATPEGNLIQVFDTQGRRLYPPSLQDAVLFPWPDLRKSLSDYRGEAIYRGRHYRVMAKVTAVDGAPARLFIAGQLEDNRNILQRFYRGLLAAIPPLLILSALAGYFLSRRALNPIKRLIASVRSITIGDLSRRLPSSETGDELQRLAETCNDMLARLETAVTRINRFTGDASHELRTPLSYIRMLAECGLKTPGLQEEIAESFREIVAESDSATKLLEDMLTLARSDAGQAQVPFETVNISEIVADAAARMRPFSEAKQQRFSIEIPESRLFIEGDDGGLRRLVCILIDNAIKYTPNGGRIETSLRCVSNRISLSVADTGIGVAETDIPRLFDRFYRVDPSRQEGGIGLGLAIAKWIVEMHRGEVQVTSSLNFGSTFRVMLPLADERVVSVGRHG